MKNAKVAMPNRISGEKLIKILGMNEKEINNEFQLAAKNGHFEAVQFHITDKRVIPEARSNYALNWAAENGHLAVVQLLS